jgi:soluble lytic murein transglycosylase-like protein
MPLMRFLRPKTGVATIAAALLCGCGLSTSERTTPHAFLAIPQLRRTLNVALSWPSPAYADTLEGARLFEDGTSAGSARVALTRAILLVNPRITAIGALQLADATVRVAARDRLPPEFLGATLLQESAFDPNAVSPSGAMGVAQFMPETAAEYGIDPFDPYDAIGGASRLLAQYVRSYRNLYDDPYAASLAAYNAGPGAVAEYHGMPPYAETREYVRLIYERWAAMAWYESAERTSPVRVEASSRVW